MPPSHLLVERRFPLEMSVTLPEIRELYDSGKAGRWNPLRDIDWTALAPDQHDARVREAARRTWSRRLWVEATGLTETPALLMRFCMEAGREIDPKFYLTVRNTEEAWHVECLDRIAEAFGGRIAAPADKVYEATFNRNLHRRAMNAEQSLDSYVTCFAAFEDGLELELCRTWRDHRDEPGDRGRARAHHRRQGAPRRFRLAVRDLARAPVDRAGPCAHRRRADPASAKPS